jgi:hypothetical protein
MKTASFTALLCATGLALATQPGDATAQGAPCPSATAAPVKAPGPASLKIHVFEEGASVAVISIPLSLAKAASKLMPKEMQGVNMDEILKLAETAPPNGLLLDVEDHRSKSRVVISLVAD